MTARLSLPLTLSEADLQRTVIDYAMVRGWLVSHQRPARTAKGWATPITGHPGLPDLILARNGTVYMIELKTHTGRATPGQRRWLEAVGHHGRLWRPDDWAEIVETLA